MSAAPDLEDDVRSGIGREMTACRRCALSRSTVAGVTAMAPRRPFGVAR